MKEDSGAESIIHSNPYLNRGYTIIHSLGLIVTSLFDRSGTAAEKSDGWIGLNTLSPEHPMYVADSMESAPEKTVAGLDSLPDKSLPTEAA